MLAGRGAHSTSTFPPEGNGKMSGSEAHLLAGRDANSNSNCFIIKEGQKKAVEVFFLLNKNSNNQTKEAASALMTSVL